MSFERIQDGLRWLAAEFSVEPHEFHQAHKVGGPMLLEGLLSKGYAWAKGGRVAVTDAGRRVIADTKPADEVEA
jgi:hypothetical protein